MSFHITVYVARLIVSSDDREFYGSRESVNSLYHPVSLALYVIDRIFPYPSELRLVGEDGVKFCVVCICVDQDKGGGLFGTPHSGVLLLLQVAGGGSELFRHQRVVVGWGAVG